MKGWANLDPGATRPPVSISVDSLDRGHNAATKHGPSRATNLADVQCLFAAGGGSGTVGRGRGVSNQDSEVFCHQSASLGPLGVQQDESVLLDSTVLPQLGPMLGRLARRRKGTTLFDLDYAKLLTVWHQVLRQIGLPQNFAVLLSNETLRTQSRPPAPVEDSAGGQDARTLGQRYLSRGTRPTANSL